MSKSEVWKYLHDGSIDEIDGHVPGDITINISIPYLRRMLPGDGDGFRLTLLGCTQFQLIGDDDSICEDLTEITRRSPEILSLQSESPISIYTTFGTLNLAYRDISMALDCGDAVSVAIIDKASAEYWDAWSKRHAGSA